MLNVDNLETILITLFLLLPPVVLGKCRSFCERHPSTVAFRTVPIGCLTMFLLTVLLGVAVSWFYHSILKIKPAEVHLESWTFNAVHLFSPGPDADKDDDDIRFIIPIQ